MDDAAPVGRVLGSEDATPMVFHVGIGPGEYLQLDDVVVTERDVPGHGGITISGMVSEVRAVHEGARFGSDVFLIADGKLPAQTFETAEVLTTRVEPEVYVPPLPGSAVRRASGDERDRALFFDRMDQKLPIGVGRDGEALFVNLEFLDGRRGAHVNISGISGVATKTSYATFLLYSLFTSGVLGPEAINTKALIFNVKGEDLLFLDQPNNRLTDEARAKYTRLGLAAEPFPSFSVYAPPRHGDANAGPDVASRSAGVHAFYWTLAEFCQDELLPFVFADAEDERQQYTMVIHNVATRLHRDGHPAGEDGAWQIDGEVLRTYDELVHMLVARITDDDTRVEWAGPAVSLGTANAFIRRLVSSRARLSSIIRADVPWRAQHTVSTSDAQVTVVDLHNLHDRAQRFVVGVSIRREFERKELSGTARPLLFVVLDELNKYAPREGSSPIKEILLDVAERGRSLGVILVGAQQTASEVERRIIANSAIRVVGRLDPAEAGHAEYGFLPEAQRRRATIAKPGTMFVSQPEIPVPLTVEFPFPAWATRPSELVAPVAEPISPPIPSTTCEPMKILHTGDWHVGKVLKGLARLDEQRAVLGEIVDIARREQPDLVAIAGDVFETAAPPPDAQALAWRTVLDLRATGADVVVIAGNHDSPDAFDALRPVFAGLGITVLGRPRRPDDGGVIELTTRHGERAVVALLPFVSQRGVVKAAELFALDLSELAAEYAIRLTRLIEALAERFRSDAVNLLVAHGTVRGGTHGGGERDAQTVFDYTFPANTFPASASYVALGHLHRRQELPAPCPAWYPGAPFGVDFGEETDTKGVLLVDALVGRPAQVRAVPLSSARRLRTVRGTVAALVAEADTYGDDLLRVVVTEPARAGLVDEVRAALPNTLEVRVERSDESATATAARGVGQRSARELFAAYCEERNIADPRLTRLFDELYDEATAESSV